MNRLWVWFKFLWLYAAWPLLTWLLVLHFFFSRGDLKAAERGRQECRDEITKLRRQDRIERRRRNCEADAKPLSWEESRIFVERCMEEAAKEEWK